MSDLARLPLVALIGLPNSGKSTMINRIIGGKRAITDKIAHTTRDLLYGEDTWNGLAMRFVDTGGLVPRPEDKIQKMIQVKSWQAIADADLLLWIIDRKQNPDTISEEIMQRIWKTGKPFFIVINKVDDPNQERTIAEFAHLGADHFINVSATSGYGLGDLMDEIVEKLHTLGYENQILLEVNNYDDAPKKGKRAKIVAQNADGSYNVYYEDSVDDWEKHLEGRDSIISAHETPETLIKDWSKKPIKLVFLGRPNVGKSSLFNAMVGKEIQIVTEIPGTTLSVNDYLIERLRPATLANSEDSGVTAKISMPDAIDVDSGTVKNIILDLEGVVLQWNNTESVRYVESTLELIKKLRQDGFKFYYLTNILKASEQYFVNNLKSELKSHFDGGLTDFEVGFSKPQPQIYQSILDKYNLQPEESVFVDENIKNVAAAEKLGLLGITYSNGVTELEAELDSLIYEDQNYTNIPLYTNEVKTAEDPNSEHKIESEAEINQQYILLDTAGIRKPGQRTLGVETFATYRTVAAVNEADIVLLVFDASKPLTHQDQVVAGIAHESKKGLVVLLNKMDLLNQAEKDLFLRDYQSRFRFMKVDRVIWVSAEKRKNLAEIWDGVDEVIASRSKSIEPTELRKVFNYLMRQKPPAKMTDRKKPIIYDLVFTKQAPPTFELWVRFADTIHWSYVRFLSNFLGQQFDFVGGQPTIKVVEKKRMQLVKDTVTVIPVKNKHPKYTAKKSKK